VDAFGHQAQRILLIQLGAAIALRDSILHTAQTYSSIERVARELTRFERRGESAVRRGRQAFRRRRRGFEHGVRDARRQTNGWRSDAGHVVDRVRSLA
jgi:hypothetical protein